MRVYLKKEDRVIESDDVKLVRDLSTNIYKYNYYYYLRIYEISGGSFECSVQDEKTGRDILNHLVTNGYAVI